MTGILKKIDDDFRNLLEHAIGQAAEETVKTLFGCMISARDYDAAQQIEKPFITCAINFRQGLESITLRLVFDYDFILSLIDDLYSENLSEHRKREMCEDAVSELANIICNKIKLFLNSNGFLFYMDIPYIETSEKAPPNNQNIINLHFTLFDKDKIDDKNVLSIGMMLHSM